MAWDTITAFDNLPESYITDSFAGSVITIHHDFDFDLPYRACRSP